MRLGVKAVWMHMLTCQGSGPSCFVDAANCDPHSFSLLSDHTVIITLEDTGVTLGGLPTVFQQQYATSTLTALMHLVCMYASSGGSGRTVQHLARLVLTFGSGATLCTSCTGARVDLVL